MTRLSALGIFLIGLSTVFGQQSSMQCSSSDSNKNECILHHLFYISDKLEQMSTLERKIDDAVQRVEEKIQEGIGESQCDCPSDPNSSFPENCLEIYHMGHHDSGTYTVYEPQAESPFRSRRAITVFCEMDEPFGEPGWLLFQRREDGTVDFNRTWTQYRDGFGILTGEHWLGNENLAIITGTSTQYELQIDLEDWDERRRYARYGLFKIQPEAFNYTITLGTYSGDAGDAMTYHNGMQFSAPDMDNDLHLNIHCGDYFKAGWWYKSCAYAVLNTPYYNTSRTLGDARGLVWNKWHDVNYSLKRVQMKIRPLL